jgi:hypothetical protein
MPNETELSMPSTDAALSIVNSELSSRQRWIHWSILLLNFAVMAGVLSLWTTEPKPLPTRLHIGFAAIVGLAACWIAVLGWILARKHCQTAVARLATAWVAAIGSLLFFVIGISVSMSRSDSSAALILGSVGVVLIAGTVLMLRRAWADQAGLKAKLAELQALESARGKGVRLPMLMTLLACVIALRVMSPCFAEGVIDTRAQQIIARHVKACGGEAAMLRIQTRRVKGSLTRQGTSIPVEVLQATPNKSLTKTYFPKPGTLLQGYDGTVAWVEHPLQGGSVQNAAQTQSAADNSWLHRILHVKDTYSSIDFAPSQTQPNRIRLKKSDGTISHWSFDAGTGRLVLMAGSVDLGPKGEAIIEVTFTDYRETDGVFDAWRVKTVMPRVETVMQIDSIENNVEVDDESFSPSF